MASIRRISILVAVAVTAGMVALPSLASADVYCIDAPGPTCDHTDTGATGLQNAFMAAQLSNAANTVRIGAGTYATPDSLGFHYDGGSNPLTVIGAGEGSTTIQVTPPASVPAFLTQFYGLSIRGTGSGISQLTITLPTPAGSNSSNQKYLGISADANSNTISHVTVAGPVAAVDAIGIVQTSGTLSDSTISLPLGLSPQNTGLREVSNTTFNLLADRNTITGDTAFENDNQSSGISTVNRSTLRARYRGVDAVAAHIALNDDVIDLGSFNNATGVSAGYLNMFNSAPSTVDANALTIHGSGSGQRGVQAFAVDANSVPPAASPTDTATLTLTNSIIDLTGSSPTTLRREVDNGGTVNLTTDFSNYDSNPSKITDITGAGGGAGAITQSHSTNLAPSFVSPGTGDFHLQSSSPLIDIGDPAATAGGETDRDSNPRVVDGPDLGCTPRRDLGAYEVQFNEDCTPPDTSIDSGPTGPVMSNAPTFGFSSTESPATYLCSVDGAAFTPCTSPLTTSPLPDGAHSFAVLSVDGNLNADASPATRDFSVDTAAPDTSVSGKAKVRTRKKKALVRFNLGTTELGSTLECSLDGRPFAPCASPFSARLPRGPHTLRVRSRDAAGNLDASPASFTTRVKRLQ